MRFKALLAPLAALSLAASAASQPAAPAPLPSFSPEAFRSHIVFLADDLLEGREAGTRGFDIAARYVASEFEGLGLTPAAGGHWLQPVELGRYTVAGTPTLTVAGHVFTQGHELAMRSSADRNPLSLDAGMVFAGYGLDMPSHGFDDYHGLDVRGKIVVVLNGTPAGVPSDVAAHLNSDKRRMAAARGAAGMILIRSRAEAARTPWARLAGFSGRASTTWLEPDGTPHDGAGLRFTATVSDEAAETLFHGARRSLGAILDEAARAGARPRGFALAETAHVARDAMTEVRSPSANVVAMLPGSDPALAGQYVLLMAHLDHLGIRPPRPNDGPNTDRLYNGAMDNASGIATLIEVARQMSRDPARPRRPILFAAVTGEEKGELGSEYLSRHPVTNGRIVAVVNLDMPILTYDFQDVVAFGAEHSTLGAIVERAAARMNVRLSPDPLPEEGLFTRSDHYRFVMQGVPSVFLMTGFAGEGAHQFRNFLDTRYHQPSDDLNQAFNWQAGAKFALLNYLIAREIADEPAVPLWYQGSFFGDAFGGNQPRAPAPATH